MSGSDSFLTRMRLRMPGTSRAEARSCPYAYWQVTVPIDHPADGEGWHTFVGQSDAPEHALDAARSACEHPATGHCRTDGWGDWETCGLRPGWTAHWDRATATPWHDAGQRKIAVLAAVAEDDDPFRDA